MDNELNTYQEDWIPVTEYRDLHNIDDLSKKAWETFRKEHSLETKNVKGVWNVRSKKTMDEDESIEAELVDIPTGKLSVIQFGGLTIGNHSRVGVIEMNTNRFDMQAMNSELSSFNEQIDAVDNLLDQATHLLQEKAVEIELAVQGKRDRLTKLDEKLLATRTQAKILKDKVIINSIESGELNREFLGKQDQLKVVVEEVSTLLE